MSRRTVYTIITPLPPQITRETALAALHDHSLMIELNPMVVNHFRCRPPRFSPADEYHSPWYEIHDKVHYTPGGAISGKVVYHACLHDLPNGLQTHCYAAMGTNIRGKWLLCGTLPGEPPQVRELGIDAPMQGLYVREDIDMKTSFLMTRFVRKNLQRAHQALLERLIVGVGLVDSMPPPISPAADSPPPVARNRDLIGYVSSSYSPPVHLSPMLARPSMRNAAWQRERERVRIAESSSASSSATSSRRSSFSASSQTSIQTTIVEPPDVAYAKAHSPKSVSFRDPDTDDAELAVPPEIARGARYEHGTSTIGRISEESASVGGRP